MLKATTCCELILARIEEALSDTHPQLFEAILTQKRAAKAKLAELAAKHGWKKVATHRTHRGTLTDALVRSSGFSPFLDTTDGFDRFELEACDALIAQTGSVFLTPRSGGGSALSVLPEHHVVLARRDQLLPDFPAGYELIQQRYGAACPSRTGDIERIIILGAHGPKKLTIILW